MSKINEMKPITFLLVRAAALWLVVSSAFLPIVGTASIATDVIGNPESVAVITCYQVKKNYLDQFRKALRSYVSYAVNHEQNIMAEAFFEENNSSVLWVIERWDNRNELNKSHGHARFKSIETLAQKGTEQPVREIHIKDLEPISRKEWRKDAASGDSPIVIMLFVDSKAGTEEDFKSLYHEAMPQFRGEPGVINYQLSQLNEDKTQFVTYEKFRNEEAFQYHLNFPPIKPVVEYLNRSIKQQPFQIGLHRLILIPEVK